MTQQWQLSGNAEGVDWSDLAMAGRAYADNLVGEPAVSKVMHMMADEIEKLRGTPPPHATHPQGSVQDRGSFLDSRNAKEPVAWGVLEPDGFGIEGTFTDRDEAVKWCNNRQQIVPLYRDQPPPTLTDAERQAVETFAFDRPMDRATAAQTAATLRALLARLGGTDDQA